MIIDTVLLTPRCREGVTSYYSGLLVERAGLRTPTEYLESLGAHIGQLQKAPGRLLQTVEQSSLEVWNNSNSGVNPSATTVSYYTKGEVLGFLLDATIRHATAGRKSFDDVMRLAYERYGGPRGFTAQEFRATAEEVAGTDLKEWFRKSVSSTEELDYTEALTWYGLQFVTPDGPGGDWTLKPLDEATTQQRQNLAALLRSARAQPGSEPEDPDRGPIHARAARYFFTPH